MEKSFTPYSEEKASALTRACQVTVANGSIIERFGKTFPYLSEAQTQEAGSSHEEPQEV
jgi:hypothetical protein